MGSRGRGINRMVGTKRAATGRNFLVALILCLGSAILSGCGGPLEPAAGGLGTSGAGPGPGTGGGGGSNPGDPPPPTPDPPPPPPSGDPNTGLAFSWQVGATTVTPPAFVPSPGPAGAAVNEVSRYQHSPQVSLSLYRRWIPGSAVSLLEVAIFNDPLTCQNQGGAG